MNLLLLTDSYKITHWKQYPPKTTNVYSYFESRGGMFDSTVFFGLQYFLKKYLEGPVITKEDIDEAERLTTMHFNKNLFNREGWEYIVSAWGGKLPVRIMAVPEGTVVPTGNVMMTIENMDVKCHWLTNYLETLLVQVWYPTTVCTLSYRIKKMMLRYLKDTGDPSTVDFMLHDFGFRGVSSVESAGIGGVSHLVNFIGTDTMAALTMAREYYSEEMAGFSIPAAEHSTITAWGKENEWLAMKNMLEQFPTGYVAVVSDSYNIYNACRQIWGMHLKDMILGREGAVVIRLDSGDPLEVIASVLETLGERFGYETNKKGYAVLNPKVRIIQSDGVDYDSIGDILSMMKSGGWSANNIAFGMGGALLQKLNRDTQKFAFKCSSAIIDGQVRNVWKSPVTDPNKNSKRGRLRLIRHYGKFETVKAEDYDEEDDCLIKVFENGQIIRHQTLGEIRQRAKEYLEREIDT